MAKSELLESAKKIETTAKQLLEKTVALRTEVSGSLQAAKRFESKLMSKERAEREERLEREKAERLIEYLNSEERVGVYVSDLDEISSRDTAADSPKAETTAEKKQDITPEAPKTVNENTVLNGANAEPAVADKVAAENAKDNEKNTNTEKQKAETAPKNAAGVEVISEKPKAEVVSAANASRDTASDVPTAHEAVSAEKNTVAEPENQSSQPAQKAEDKATDLGANAQKADRPQGDSRTQNDRPQGDNRTQSDRPRYDNRTQSDRPRYDNRTQSDRPQGDNRTQSDRPRYDNRPQGDNRTQSDRPQGDNRTQSDRPRYDNRTQGDRPQGDNRTQSDRPQGDNRTQSDRPRYDNRPQGDRPRYDNRPQGDRPQYGDRTQSNRPQGDRPQYGDRTQSNRPQGDRPQYGDRTQSNRPQGDRPQYGDRTQGNRPQGDRPPFQRNNDMNKDATQRTNRPQGGTKPPMRRPSDAPVIVAKENRTPDRGNYVRSFDNDKKTKNKKAALKETAPSTVNWDDDGAGFGGRKKRPNKQVEIRKPEPVVIDKAIITTETITVRDFSEKIGKPAAEIIKKLFMMNIVASINQEIDFPTCELIALEYNIELEQQIAKTYEEAMQEVAEEEDTEDNLITRPPVVTIMGHVDHGKTSLLDAIRNSSITAGEAGGITQHIGAYTVNCNGRMITFIDTPGHEAFTSMRARGAQVTDVVILVVAAEDGIMPQTIEAINHSKAAGVPIIVAMNKIDKPEANPERVKQQLTEHGLVCEDWGGDTICVPVSAKKQINLDTLLEMVLLQADVLELKANPKRAAKGTIIEAQLDKGRGPVATVLVQNGTLNVGDPIVAGIAYGKVRAMTDDKGKPVKSAGPSQPVEVLGFNEVPSAGDIMNVAEVSRKVAEERRNKIKAEQLKTFSKVSLEDLFSHIAEGEIKSLNVVVKADVHGSVEAVKQALEKLSNEEVHVKCIHGGVGAINESDIMFASASNAIVIGFNVRPDGGARTLAEQEKVDVRTYRIIYQAIEDVQNAMKGMFKPVYKEAHLGTVSVRSTFRVSNVGVIAGAYVQDGKVQRNAQVRVVRDGVVIHEGQIASLRRFKDDVKEVATGYECGISIEDFNDIHEGDQIEAYIMEEVKR